METVDGVEGHEKELGQETDVEVVTIISGEAGSEELISNTNNADPDPVVYQLVRVDGDGRLVPATDNEVLVVENLLEDKKAEDFISGNNRHTSCSKTEKSQMEEKQNSQLENLGTTNVQRQETVHQFDQPCNSNEIMPCMSIGNPKSARLLEEGSSNPNFASSSKPDFSRLRGEICLDKLSVKELQETFRATFGRETFVKDKQWLKRRISMALTNSCDVSTTTFIIKGNKVVKKLREEKTKTFAASANFVMEVSPYDGVHSQEVSHPAAMNEDTRSTVLERGDVIEDHNLESRTAKRIRKPTKRYIEELSEMESDDSKGKLIPQTLKNFEHEQLPHLKPHIRPVQKVRSDGKPVVTRQDSLGGSDVMVPYVWRIRRSRPRENFMPLMKLQPISIDADTGMVKKTNGTAQPPVEDETDKLLQTRLSECSQQPLILASEESEPHLEKKAVELEKEYALKRTDSFEDNSDDNMLWTPSCGMRRKHHRPWSLTEVVKLVEGVAKYGVGRWSEIKRVAFASYSYRTSVDLKDKWRNLLKASSLQLPGEKGNIRKHASVPIPASILIRVKELAQMQAPQVPTKLPQIKVTGSAGGDDRSVTETRAGFL